MQAQLNRMAKLFCISLFTAWELLLTLFQLWRGSGPFPQAEEVGTGAFEPWKVPFLGCCFCEICLYIIPFTAISHLPNRAGIG